MRICDIAFFAIFLFLPWMWIEAPHGNEDPNQVLSQVKRNIALTEEDYLSYIQFSVDRSERARIFFRLPGEVIRFWRFVKDPRCWRPNPDDPEGEILKGVDCPRRLRILDRENPLRKCIGVLKGKHRARDGDLTFDVLPNGECLYLINKSNTRMGKGGLHCEIVPDDTAKFSYIFNQMKLNNTVEVEGVWVEDINHHNWRELHPVKNLRLVGEKEK